MVADVALYGPDRAGVLLDPPPAPGDTAGLVALAVGASALACGRQEAGRAQAHLDGLRRAAVGIAGAGDGPVPEGLIPLDPYGRPEHLRLVPREGPGRVNVRMEVLGTVGGPVPRLATRATGPVTLAIASLATLLAVAAAGDRESRLALGLAIEGLLAWHAESHRSSPPRLALAYALEHARRRLEAAGRPAPEGL